MFVAVNFSQTVALLTGAFLILMHAMATKLS